MALTYEAIVALAVVVVTVGVVPIGDADVVVITSIVGVEVVVLAFAVVGDVLEVLSVAPAVKYA
jgi:hypothetical protein